MSRRTLFSILVGTFLLGLTAAADAQDRRACSTARAAGEWGYTKTGTLVLPTGATPFASVGRFSLGADGVMVGENNGSVGGRVSKDVLKGTFEVNPDCTGAMTVEVYDESGNLLRTIAMALVFVDDGRAARGIVTSLVLPNGASLPSIITADAKRLHRNYGNRDWSR
jgi:hypothetical protein